MDLQEGISAASSLLNATKEVAEAGKDLNNAVSSDPNLEDRVSEALLKITANEKFIESMSSNISSIIKSEILKPVLTMQLNKVNDIIAQVEKLECNNKEVKKEDAKAVANTIQEAIGENDINVSVEEGSATNTEGSSTIEQVPATNTEEPKEEETKAQEGGKVRKSRRKNTKKSHKSRRNKRRN